MFLRGGSLPAGLLAALLFGLEYLLVHEGLRRDPPERPMAEAVPPIM